MTGNENWEKGPIRMTSTLIYVLIEPWLCESVHTWKFSSQRNKFWSASFSICRVISWLIFLSAFAFLAPPPDENMNRPSIEGIRNFISIVPEHWITKDSFLSLPKYWLLLVLDDGVCFRKQSRVNSFVSEFLEPCLLFFPFELLLLRVSLLNNQTMDLDPLETVL